MSRESETAAGAHNQAALDGRRDGEEAKNEPVVTAGEVLGNLIFGGIPVGSLMRDSSHYEPPSDPALRETYDQEYKKSRNS